jgi:hypothetical protein
MASLQPLVALLVVVALDQEVHGTRGLLGDAATMLAAKKV